MNKKIIVALLLVALLLTACSPKVNNSSAPEGEKPKEGETVVINIPTAATTGALYPLGSSLATLWTNNLENVKASAQASNGGIDNLNLIQSGDAQVSMGVTSIIYQSFKGTDTFEGRPNDKLRIISALYFNPNQVVVRKDSGIDTLADIKGKNFASGAPGSTTEVETKIHLEAIGVKYPDEIKAQFVGFTEASELMRNKQLEGAWIMAGIPTAAVTEITTTADGKIIPIGKEVVEKLKETHPWYANYTIPAGTYEGLDTDVNTSAIKMALYTTTDMSEDVVYELTKSFWENIEKLAETNKSLEGLKVEDAVNEIADLPLHDGAIKYYKEVGVIK